ncbi:MAG: signal recognition particle-docking protein FtsY [Colwellia sp.]
MSKKKGMFSWLGFSQDEEQKTQAVEENTEHLTVDTEIAKPEILEPAISETENVEVEVEVENTDTAEKTLKAEDVLSKDSSKDSSITTELADDNTIVSEKSAVEENNLATPEIKLGFFARLKQGLSKTRQNIGGGLFDLFRDKQIDDDLFEELETHLLLADVGVETTTKIIDSLTKNANRKQLKDAEALYDLLKIELTKIIEGVSKPLEIPESNAPFVMLMVGVNGVGKTTTIGKLAKQFQAQGKSVMLAAGDTFRAAAVEQLQVWGERNNIPVIAQHTGADSASVIFDAISAAKARNVDVLIADTAGRLQNKGHLMEELKKVVRVMKKLDESAPHEVMLTLDAGTGQNALSQTKLFDEAVGLTGLTVSKLDGTAKGGVVFAIADKHNIPIRYLGVGEGIDDLRPFNGDDFINALFEK